MIRSERLEFLLTELRRRGVVSITAMARRLGVSPVTVRRDVDELVAEGIVERVRGGARLCESEQKPGVLTAVNSAEMSDFELRIASLVRPGQMVGITGRRFAPAVARALSTIEDVGIVSNSLAVVDVLKQCSFVPMVVIGGVITENGCMAGPLAVDALRRLHLDVVFIEGEGLDPEAGVTTRNLLEAEASVAMISAADTCYLSGSPDQWRRVSLTTITDLEAVEGVVFSPVPETRHEPEWIEHFRSVL